MKPLRCIATIVLVLAFCTATAVAQLPKLETTPSTDRARQAWKTVTRGTNLAAGKTVQFSIPPEYRLTRSDSDPTDLTDGKLSTRRDDKIWFDSTAVGWTRGPVNLMLDLGEVQPVSRVAIRCLAGAEQGSLRAPKSLELVVSTDGKTFYNVASLNKLMLGEKDRDGEQGVFFVPEEGKAYTWPFVFDNLKTKARYVGLKMQGETGYIFADELVVLKGDHRADAVAYEPKDRTGFVIRGISFGPFKPWLAISTNVNTPNYFRLLDCREAKDQKQQARLVVEVPEGVGILPTAGSPGDLTLEKFDRGGRPWVRYGSYNPGKTHNYHGPYFFQVEDPARLRDAVAVFYAEAPGYEPNRMEVPIRPIEIPEVGRFKKLHVSLAWMGAVSEERWPGFWKTWQTLGFNAVGTFPRYWRNGVPSEMQQAFMDKARQSGMAVIYNESPFHVMKSRRKNEKEIYSQIPDRESTNTCPSYRGQFYQEEIRRVGDLYERSRAEFVFLDIELWYRGAREADKCTRCSRRHEASGKPMDDFLTDLGTEMIADIHKELAERSQKLGIPAPHLGIYNNHAARPIYHLAYDFRKLYPEYLDSAQPSLYVQGNAVRVHKAMAGNWKALGKRLTIPWHTAGTYGEFDSPKLEPCLLETFVGGGLGITYYYHGNFDTPMDYYYQARALAQLQPHEDMIAASRVVEVNHDNQKLFVSACRHEGEMLVLVGNYQNATDGKVRITVPLAAVEQVTDLGSGKPMPAGKTVELNLKPGEHRLLYVKGKQ